MAFILLLQACKKWMTKSQNTNKTLDPFGVGSFWGMDKNDHNKYE
jgi:hypothetical protein